MPTFNYTAIDPNNKGKEKKGKIDAPNENAAATKLKEQGMFPTSVTLVKAAGGTQGKKGGGFNMNISFGPMVIKGKDLVILTRQLAILQDAGLPLLRSLRTLQKQAKNPAVAKVMADTAEKVEGGSTFSEALAQNPKSFDKLYLNMIRAGEAAGALETILNRLAFFMEKAAKIAGKIKSAMIYPTVILSIALIMGVSLMIFVVPNFTKIFNELLAGKPLPGLTQGLIALSTQMKDNGLVFFPSVIGGIIVLWLLMTKTKYGRLGLDYMKFYMPVVGPLVSKTAIARFSRTLGTLQASGVNLLGALSIVKETAGNIVVSAAIQKVHDAVKEGEGVAAPLGATKIFPEMVISMVEVGEETGKLPEMLEKIADTYEEEVDNAVGALTSLIEPIMIVGLAVMVGTIVIALFLPLVDIIESLGS